MIIHHMTHHGSKLDNHHELFYKSCFHTERFTTEMLRFVISNSDKEIAQEQCVGM